MPPTVIVWTTVTNTSLVQTVSVQGAGVAAVVGDIEELTESGTEVSSLVELGVIEKGNPRLGAELGKLALVAVSTRLELTELALASLSIDKDDRTLRMELVALNPVVIVGIVPARLIV
jgi:hypothetical protein